MDVGDLVAGRYRVTGLLAHGGMAEVLAAHDDRLDREVALKVVRSAGGPDRVRFGAEVRLLASFQHPHLARVFDAGVDGDQPFLVLELAEGPNLAQLLAAGPLPAGRFRSLGRDVAGALAHVHAAGVVHRDVKPANVLTGADGRWLLADFGIARLVDATRLTVTGQAIGTPAYLAPEQLTDTTVTPAVDVYSLGLTLLEATTGRRAFPGSGTEAAMARLARDPDVSAAPAAERELLAAMTARDPAVRPSAAEVARRLSHDVHGSPTEPLLLPAGSAAVTATSPLPVVEPVAAAPVWGAPGRRTRPWVGVAAAIFVLVLVAAAALAWLGGDGSGGATAATTSVAQVTTTSVAAATTAPTAAAPVTTVPVAASPSTTADPCAVLQARLDQLDRAGVVVDRREPPPGRGHGHPHDDRHASDEQRRELERQLHAAHC